MNQSIINLIVVDDHTMVVEGMRAMLSTLQGIHLEATASNALQAMNLLRQDHADIQIAFIDINMPDISGIELCSNIKKEFPQVKVIALSTFKQRSYVSQMIANGASGYLLKSAGREEISEAIRTVSQGKMFFSADINNNTPDIPPEDVLPILTRREKEILQMIAEGMTNNQIATKLFVSPYTVDTHRKNLLAKFEVANTALLIKKAAAFHQIK